MTHEYVCACGKKTKREFPIGKSKGKVKCTCGKMAKKALGMPMMKSVLTQV